MIWFVGTVYVVGWFLLSVSGLFTLVSMLRGRKTFVALSGPFLLLVGIAVYSTGGHLRTHLDPPSVLLFWIPAALGAVCGAIAGYGVEAGGAERHKFRHVALSLALIAAGIWVAGRGGSESDDLQEFCWSVFEALQGGDVETLATRLSINASDLHKHVSDVRDLSSNVEWRLSDDLNDEDLTQSARESIRLFRSSYEDVLDGKLSYFSARVNKELGTASLILWVKKGDGYKGILIHSVILANDGYKVMDWIGPIAVPSRGVESLRKKRAILESDNEEGCVYPHTGITFQYEFD